MARTLESQGDRSFNSSGGLYNPWMGIFKTSCQRLRSILSDLLRGSHDSQPNSEVPHFEGEGNCPGNRLVDWLAYCKEPEGGGQFRNNEHNCRIIHVT